MARRSTAIARRRGPSAAVKLRNAQSKLTSLRKQITEGRVPNALFHAAAVVGGSAASGALKAAVGEEIAGVDTGVVGGLVAGTAGVALQQPWLIYSGAGMLAPYAHDFAYDAVADMMDNRKADTPNLRAVQ